MEAGTGSPFGPQTLAPEEAMGGTDAVGKRLLEVTVLPQVALTAGGEPEGPRQEDQLG